MSTIESRRAYRVYLMFSGASSLFFTLVFTVNIIYQATTVGLSPLQLVLVGTALEVSAFLFEIPTGVVADVYSRRLSIIVGFVLIGISFMIEGLVPRFGAIVVAQAVLGFGWTFTSGATEAWITDEIGESAAAQAFVRSSQIARLFGMIGIVISVALASIQINLPIVLGGVLMSGLGLLLIFVMPENGFQRMPRGDRTTWQVTTGTFHEGVRLVRLRRTLIIFLLVAFVVGFYSEGFDRLWQKHVLDDFVLPGIGVLQPVVWFGIISMVSSLLSIGFAEIVRRRVNLTDHLSSVRALMLIYAVMAAGMIAFSLMGNLWLALIAYWVVASVRSASGPIRTAWLNQSLEPRVRATMFSISSQADALGQITGGPPVGAIGNFISVKAALATSGAILSLTLPLLMYSRRYQPVEVGDVVVEAASD